MLPLETTCFGSPAILGSFRRTSGGKRGPVALRHQLWLVLPLSIKDGDRTVNPVNSEIYGVRSNDRFGSVAVVQGNSNPMAALEWQADPQAVRMSAPTNIRHSKALKLTELNGR